MCMQNLIDPLYAVIAILHIPILTTFGFIKNVLMKAALIWFVEGAEFKTKANKF